MATLAKILRSNRQAHTPIPLNINQATSLLPTIFSIANCPGPNRRSVTQIIRGHTAAIVVHHNYVRPTHVVTAITLLGDTVRTQVVTRLG